MAASVTVPRTIEGVTAAGVELGYVNGFHHLWVGPAADSGPGTTAHADAWVADLGRSLDTTGGVLAEGRHLAVFQVPAGAPGSCAKAVRWQARLRIARRGRDVALDAPVSVVVTAPEPAPLRVDLPLVQGERALGDTVFFDAVTERTCYRPGDEVRGVLGLTVHRPDARKALVAAWFQQLLYSHPLDKVPPGVPSESYLPRPMITIARDVQLAAGRRLELPFTLPLPPGVDPTTNAVHSSVRWNIQFKVEFAGLTGGIERAQLPIVVHTG